MTYQSASNRLIIKPPTTDNLRFIFNMSFHSHFHSLAYSLKVFDHVGYFQFAVTLNKFSAPPKKNGGGAKMQRRRNGKFGSGAITFRSAAEAEFGGAGQIGSDIGISMIASCQVVRRLKRIRSAYCACAVCAREVCVV